MEPASRGGLPIPGGHFAMLDDRLDFRALETPFPYTLALPQARTEELLEEHTLALGATIVRGHRVSGFTEHAESVTVQVDGLDESYELQAAFIIGCDGSRSTVRTTAGIDFIGTPSTVLGWLGDVTLDSPPRPGFSTFGLRGGVMVAPLPGGRYRVVGVSPDSLTTEWPGDPTLEELRAKTVAITGEDFGMRDPVWLSRFGNATRLAAQYRRGRILLAGDAAQQHFPAGGVGMNVGIQDAHNLGWKLAATLRGRAPDHLLDKRCWPGGHPGARRTHGGSPRTRSSWSSPAAAARPRTAERRRPGRARTPSPAATAGRSTPPLRHRIQRRSDHVQRLRP